MKSHASTQGGQSTDAVEFRPWRLVLVPAILLVLGTCVFAGLTLLWPTLWRAYPALVACLVFTLAVTWFIGMPRNAIRISYTEASGPMLWGGRARIRLEDIDRTRSASRRRIDRLYGMQRIYAEDGRRIVIWSCYFSKVEVRSMLKLLGVDETT
jgi:hypothetical protein